MKLKPAILALAMASLGTSSQANAEIGVGDIAIIRVNNTTDSFSYVSLVNITGSETIKWTDSSWNTSNGPWRTSENSGSTFTAPATAGTIGNISLNGFNNGGEALFLFQGDFTASSTAVSAKQKFGINWDNSGWVTTSTTTDASAQPSTLVGNNGSLALGTGDQWYYSGMLTGTPKTLLSAIANPANWTATTTTASTYDGVRSGAAFTINSSASFLWDNNGNSANTGGTGTWDATTASKWSDSANTTFLNNWVNSSTGNDHTAVFGGTAGTVSIASGGVTASGLQFDTTGYTIQSNTLNLAGSSPTISVTTAGHSATISSTLAGYTGLTKSGAGILNLTGTNSTDIGATNVTAGTLVVGVGGTGSLTSAVTVSNAGSKLGGSGTITGNVQINNGAILAPGNSPGLLTVNGDLTLANNSIFEWQLSSETTVGRGTAFDAVDVSGTLNVTGSVYKIIVANLNIGSTFWDADHTWDVFNKASTGTFASFQLYDASNLTSQVSYNTQGSFSFDSASGDLKWNFSAVPEPTGAVVGLLISAGLLRRRRGV
jgi:fibronectin-binding autotransporter adhesin